MEYVMRILAVFVGLFVIAGSVYIWHELHVDGLVAGILGLIGLMMIGGGLSSPSGGENHE